MGLQLVPMSQAEAKIFIDGHHRHSVVPLGSVFQVGVSDGDRIRGVAVVGRPVARSLQDGWTAEVTRCCTDGAPNACSMLYGACWRAAKALGYRKLITYTLASEGGTSLQASGWKVVAELQSCGRKGWNRPSRPRVEVPGQERLRWEAVG